VKHGLSHILLLLIGMMAGWSLLLAQTPDTTGASLQKTAWAKKMVKRYYHFSGNFGAFGEVYNTTAQYKRRPASTARSTLNMTFGFWKIEMPVTLILSTEEVTFRQSFNRLGLNPKIGFVTFHIGDFAGKISDYTVSGISIRGGGVDIAPTWMRLMFFYGQTQRAVNDPRAQTYAYKRMLMAGKLGIGVTNETYIDINVMKAVDDSTSLRLPVDSTKVRPQENVVVGINGQIALFRHKFRLRGEGAVSVHTMDMYAPTVESDDIPQNISKYFTIRSSTRMDYAYRGDVAINTRVVRFNAAYQRIEPGFVSLGLPYTMNDRERYNGNLNVQIVPGKFSVRGNFNYSHDNLNNQKVKTQQHISYMAGVMMKPLRPLVLNLTYSSNRLENEANLDSLIYWENNVEKKRMLFDTYNDRYMMNGSYVFRLKRLTNTLTFAYSLQKSQKRNEVENQDAFDAQMINAGYNVVVSPKFTVGVNFTNTSNKVTTGTIQSQTYGGMIGINPFTQWRNSFSVSVQSSGEQKSVNYTLTSRFRVTMRSSLNLNLIKLDFFDPVNPSREYKEHRGTLSFNYNF